MARNVDLQLAANVRERMRALDLSFEDVADATGADEDGQPALSAKTVKNLVNSGWAPNLASLRALASALDVTVGELLGEGIPAGAGRLAPLLAYAADLETSDIEALAVMAKQLASARRQAIALDLSQLPGWDRAPLEFRRAAIEATEEVIRAEPLRAAEEPATYRAGRPRRGSTRGRGGGPGGRSAPGA